MLVIKILGTPEAKQSFRYAVRPTKSGKNFVSKYQPKKVVQNERNMAFDIKSQLQPDFKPFDCPIKVDIVFVFPPPKSWSKKQLKAFQAGEVFYKDTKPDIDNSAKQCLDCMAGLVYVNDSRIVKLSLEKVYGDTPRTEIIVNPVYLQVNLYDGAKLGMELTPTQKDLGFDLPHSEGGEITKTE